MAASSLPVLLYHYISRNKDSIAVAPESFERQLHGLKRAGYRGVGLDEAVDYLLRGEPLPDRSVLITFDDGFLDNWVHAFPLLRQYGHRAGIFLVAGKIAQAQTTRPTLDDLRAGRAAPEGLACVDQPFVTDARGFCVRQDAFLNWAECRAMEADGTVALATHSLWHESVFRGPVFKAERTLFMPGPRKRTFDRVAGPVPWGLPRFDVGPALSTRAFLLSDELLALVQRTVPQNTDEAALFFDNPEHVRQVWATIDTLPVARWGRLESEREFEMRVADDLGRCRDLLDKELGAGRPCRQALAWPWGACSAAGQAVAQALGFRVFFATTFGPNPPGRPDAVHRFKARDKSALWLRSRCMIYASPLLGRLYAAMRI